MCFQDTPQELEVFQSKGICKSAVMNITSAEGLSHRRLQYKRSRGLGRVHSFGLHCPGEDTDED